jgi:hypothetical protein
MILAALAVVTATFQPPAPKVGDLITVEFRQPVQLEQAAGYEIVSQSGNRAIVRTFEPKPFALSGVTGDVRFRNLVIPVGSVLKKNDDLVPAPLVPPLKGEAPREPFLAIAIAFLSAAIIWFAVWWRSRRRTAVDVPVLAPDERFRRAVFELRQRPAGQRWAVLADETRRFLAATRPELRDDLTTSELVPRLRRDEEVVVEILRQGDLEKFSAHGPEPRDFDSVAEHALELARPPEEPAA